MLDVKDAKVTVLAGPAHGSVEASNYISKWGAYFEYGPNPSFLGEDKVTFLVELGDMRVNVVATFIVVENSVDQGDSPCFHGVKLIGSTDTPTIATDLVAWLSVTQLSGQIDGSVTIDFDNEPATESNLKHLIAEPGWLFVSEEFQDRGARHPLCAISGLCSPS